MGSDAGMTSLLGRVRSSPIVLCSGMPLFTRLRGVAGRTAGRRRNGAFRTPGRDSPVRREAGSWFRGEPRPAERSAPERIRRTRRGAYARRRSPDQRSGRGKVASPVTIGGSIALIVIGAIL